MGDTADESWIPPPVEFRPLKFRLVRRCQTNESFHLAFLAKGLNGAAIHDLKKLPCSPFCGGCGNALNNQLPSVDC